MRFAKAISGIQRKTTLYPSHYNPYPWQHLIQLCRVTDTVTPRTLHSCLMNQGPLVHTSFTMTTEPRDLVGEGERQGEAEGGRSTHMARNSSKTVLVKVMNKQKDLHHESAQQRTHCTDPRYSRHPSPEMRSLGYKPHRASDGTNAELDACKCLRHRLENEWHGQGTRTWGAGLGVGGGGMLTSVGKYSARPCQTLPLPPSAPGVTRGHTVQKSNTSTSKDI